MCINFTGWFSFIKQIDIFHKKELSKEEQQEINLKRIKLLPYYWKVKLEVENKNKINK